MKEIKDQFKNEFQSLTLEGDSFYIDDAAERPLGLVPYGEPVQEVIEEELGTTVEGETVVVSDGDPEKEVYDVIYGNSKQETTEGYNIFDLNNYGTKTINGVKVTQNEDGSFNANGTGTSAYITFKDYENITDKLEDGETYTLWCNKPSALFYSQVQITPIEGSVQYITTGNSSPTFKVNKSANSKYLIKLQSGASSKDATYDLSNLQFMLYKGTDNKPWEKFTGGQASPNTEYKQDIEVIDGVNRLNPANVNSSSTLPNTLIEKTRYRLTSSTLGNALIFKDLGLKKGTYTVSIQIVSGDYQGGNLVLRNSENASAGEVAIKGTKNKISLVVKDNDINSLVLWQVPAGTDIVYDIQIEKGEKSSAFLPYGHIGLVQSGKNMFKTSKPIGNSYTSNGIVFTIKSPTIIHAKGTATGAHAELFLIGNTWEESNNKYENLKIGKDYTVSMKVKTPQVYTYWINGKSNTIAPLDSVKSNKSFIATEQGISKLLIRVFQGVTVDEDIELQLEPGNVATEIEPYIEPKTIEIDLAGERLAKVGEIADILKIGVDGSVSITKKIIDEILNGVTKLFVSKLGTKSNNLIVTNSFNQKITPAPNHDTLVNHYCNYFKSHSTNDLYQYDKVGSSIRQDKTIAIGFGLNSEIDTFEKANQWLIDKIAEGNPVKLLLPLQEEYYETIPLPSIEPITLFEGTNVFELETNLGTTMALTYDYVTPAPSIDRPSEILTVKGSYDTELKNEDASIINNLPLTLTKELLGEIVTLTEEEATNLGLDGAGKYRRTDYGRYVFKGVESFSLSSYSTNERICAYLNILTTLVPEEIQCNMIKTGSYTNNLTDELITTTSNSFNIAVFTSRLTDNSIDGLNQFLKSLYDAGTPMEIIYKLANPTYEKITDETELAQLSAYDKQIAFYGINNINTYPTDDLEKAPLGLKVTYDKSNRIIK